MNGTSQLEHGQPMELLAVGYIKTIFNTFMSKIELNQQSIKIDYKTTATKHASHPRIGNYCTQTIHVPCC